MAGVEAVEESGRDEVSHRVYMDSFRQVMTSWGALSSAWERVSYTELREYRPWMWAGTGMTDQMVAILQRAGGRNGDE